MSFTATAAVALLLAASAQDPFEELGTCPGNRPGPEPGRTVFQLCVPELVKAWADNGLVPVPQARRLQPVALPRMDFTGLAGDPVALRLNGGVRLLGGLTLRNRDRVTITTRIDVVYWDGRSRYGRQGYRQLRLRPGTRVRVRGHTVIELVFGDRVVRIPLRRMLVTED